MNKWQVLRAAGTRLPLRVYRPYPSFGCPVMPWYTKKLGLPTLLVVDCPQKTNKKTAKSYWTMCPWDLSFLILFCWVPSMLPLSADATTNPTMEIVDHGISMPPNGELNTLKLPDSTRQLARQKKNWSIKIWRNFFSVSFLTKFVFFHCPSEPHIWTRGVYAPQKEPARKDSRTKSLNCRDVVPGDQLQVITCSKSLQNYGLSPASWGLALLCPATRQQPTAGLFHLAGWEGIPQSQVTSPIHLLQLPARPVDLCGNLEFQLKKHPSIHPISNCGCTLANQIHRAESALQLHS